MSNRLRTTSLAVTLLLSAGVGPAAQAQAAAAERVTIGAEQAAGRGPTYTAVLRRVAELVNDARGANGRRRLVLHPMLTRKAQAWAEYLARQNTLKHSNLPSGITYQWRSLAENVGYGGSIEQVHEAYLDSPGHRANILDPRWNYMGTGVAWRGNRVFTVQVFMQY